MGIFLQLTDDMKTSMRAGDTVRTGVIRLLRGAIKDEEIKLGHGLSDAETMKVLARQSKQRRDSMAAYEAADRLDLVAVEAAELDIIGEYLPKMLSEAEIQTMVDGVIAQMPPSDSRQMGAVIGAVAQRLGAQADGGTIARLVKARLDEDKIER
jgi:uncharacterized protein YqeY